MADGQVHDINDGKEWSDIDVEDLKRSLSAGNSIEETARFLCRSGTIDEVHRKAEELGLLAS